KRDFAPGVAWHITGSTLGLDVALAPLGLHQVRADRLLEEPTLIDDERETFAISYALMNEFALDDLTRDAIANAIEKGGGRIAALQSAPESFAALADEIAMDGW